MNDEDEDEEEEQEEDEKKILSLENGEQVRRQVPSTRLRVGNVNEMRGTGLPTLMNVANVKRTIMGEFKPLF